MWEMDAHPADRVEGVFTALHDQVYQVIESGSVYGATAAVSVEVGQHCYTARPQAIVRSSAQHVALCSTLWSFGRSRRGPPRKRGHGFLRDLRPESALGGTPV